MKFSKILLPGLLVLACFSCKQPPPAEESDIAITWSQVPDPGWGSLTMADDTSTDSLMDSILAGIDVREEKFNLIDNPTYNERMHKVYRDLYDNSFVYWYARNQNQRKQAGEKIQTLLEENGDTIQDAIFFWVSKYRYPVKSNDMDLQSKNPETQLHIANLEQDSVRHHPFLYESLSVGVKNNPVHEIGILSADGKYVLPIFISSTLSNHYGHDKKNPHRANDVAFNLGLDPNSPMYQRFLRWIQQATRHAWVDTHYHEEEEDDSLGTRHKVAYFHCHAPENGRVLPPEECNMTITAEAMESSNYKQPRFNFSNRLGGPLTNANNNLLVVIPANPEADASTPAHQRVKSGRLISITYLEKDTTKNSLWPVKPQFFIVDPEME